MAPPTDSQELPTDPERALVLVERVNRAVNQQIAPLLEMVRDLQDRNGELARENGRLQAELDAARTAAMTAASHDNAPWWRRWFAP